MAKVSERSDGLSGQTTRKSDGLTGTHSTNSTAMDQTSPPTATGWRGRIGGLLAPRRTLTTAQQEAQAGRPARPPSRWGKLLFGFMVYLLGSFLLQPLILLIFQWLHINPAARQPFFPAGTWIVGNANVYTLVYFIFLAVFIWALFRFNIIPRDPFGARANAQQRQTGGGAAGATGTSTGAAGSRATGAVTRPVLSPAALRHAGRRRVPMTDGTSTPTKARAGFFARARAAATGRQISTSAPKPSAKPAPKVATTTAASAQMPAKTAATGANGAAKPPAKAAASATNGATKTLAVAAKPPAKTSAKALVPATNAPAARRSPAGTAAAATSSAGHDDHYDRIKARQRAQRRKH